MPRLFSCRSVGWGLFISSRDRAFAASAIRDRLRAPSRFADGVLGGAPSPLMPQRPICLGRLRAGKCQRRPVLSLHGNHLAPTPLYLRASVLQRRTHRLRPQRLRSLPTRPALWHHHHPQAYPRPHRPYPRRRTLLPLRHVPPSLRIAANSRIPTTPAHLHTRPTVAKNDITSTSPPRRICFFIAPPPEEHLVEKNGGT